MLPEAMASWSMLSNIWSTGSPKAFSMAALLASQPCTGALSCSSDNTLQNTCTCAQTHSLYRQHPAEILHLRTDMLTILTTPWGGPAHALRHAICTDNIPAKVLHTHIETLSVLTTPCRNLAYVHRRAHCTDTILQKSCRCAQTRSLVLTTPCGSPAHAHRHLR